MRAGWLQVPQQLRLIGFDSIRLDWIGLDWIRLDWLGFYSIELHYITLDYARAGRAKKPSQSRLACVVMALGFTIYGMGSRV